MGVDVAVVIVTFNSASAVTGLLESLPAALGAMTADVTVVDNGSTDDTVSIIADGYDWVRVVESKNDGYSAGINKGVAHSAEASSILILNPDVELGAGSIPAMTNALDSRSVGIIVPKLLDRDGELSHSLRRAPRLTRAMGLGFTKLPQFSERITDTVAYERSTTADWATGAVMLINADCFTELGGWDESFFLYSEETDFCLRAQDRGWRTTLEPSAIAVHTAGGSGRSARTQAMQALNQVRFYGRRHGPTSSWAFFLLIVVAELSRALRSRPHSRSTLKALLLPKFRPGELRLSSRLLPTDGLRQVTDGYSRLEHRRDRHG